MEKVLDIAFGEYGIKGSYARVGDYWKSISTTIRLNNFPWCGAFANYVLEAAEYKSPNSPYPKDFRTIGTELTEPKAGCVTVTKVSSPTQTGHVTFVVKVREADSKFPKAVLVLGGNQDDEVKLWWRPVTDFDSWRMPEPI